MAKPTVYGLIQTQGIFQLSGIVDGMGREKTYQEQEMKKGGLMRTVRFSVLTSNENKLFLELQGNEKQKIYVYNKDEKKSIELDFKNRTKIPKNYKLIGVNLGLKKIRNEKDKVVNDKKILCPFDATNEIFENLQDGQSVFIKGNLEFSSYQVDDNTRRNKKLVPNQISLTSKDINFEDDKFQETNNFSQTIVFTGIEKDKEQDGKYIINGLVVTYSTIEEVEFVCYNKTLANNIKKKIKPYTAMKVHGDLSQKLNVETVETENEWGQADKTNVVRNFAQLEFIVQGVDPATFDTETYTQENIEKAQQLILEAGTKYIQDKQKEGEKSKMEEEFEEEEKDWGKDFEESTDEYTQEDDF